MKAILALAVLAVSSANAATVVFQLDANCNRQSADCGWAGIAPNDAVTGTLSFERSLLPAFDAVSTTTFKASELSSFEYSFGTQSFSLSDVLPNTDIVVEISPGGVPILTGAALTLAVNSDGVEIGFERASDYQSSRVRLGLPQGDLNAFNYSGVWAATVIPIPATVWLFASSLFGLGWLNKMRA